MLILLVGLQAIPDDVYEAAALDGASRWQTFRYITLPLLRPTLALTLILCVTGSLLAFDQFYILTKGGPTTARSRWSSSSTARRSSGRTSARPRPLSIIVLVALLAAQRRPVPRPAVRGPATEPERCARRSLGRTPVLRADRRARGHLPVPAAVERVASVSPQAGTGQVNGYGFGNYTTLLNYGAGLAPTSLNSIVVSVLTVVAHAGGLAARRLRVRPVHASPARTCCSC